MKQELLEYLIRTCSCEVLKQLNESLRDFSGVSDENVPVWVRQSRERSREIDKKNPFNPKHPCPRCNGKGCSLCNQNGIDASKYFRWSEKDAMDSPNGLSESGIHIDEAESDDTKGAPAPPAAGQGTADQPAIPKDKLNESLRSMIKKMVEEVLNSK